MASWPSHYFDTLRTGRQALSASGGTRSVSGVAERVAFACACCRSETVRPQRRLYAPWKWRIPSSACPGGGRQSSRRGAAFGLHPFRRGTRRAFRCGRTLCTFFSAPSSVRGLTAPPSGMLAAKSAPRRIRRRLPAARGAARRLIRFRRRDALGGRRRSRLCAAASNLRLPMPTSSPSAPHTGGIPPWPRREWRRCRIRGETRRVLPPGALRAARPTPSGAGSAEARRGGGARPAARRRRMRCGPHGCGEHGEANPRKTSPSTGRCSRDCAHWRA